ncbi:helix-turn-helix domain-containing protein [Nonomuraea angiospora]|uniref:helix-turn-helix transcriptional regulator n=1 Tax=Nonomuraea angiospora TaxID=46172 RepID=UPI00331DED27
MKDQTSEIVAEQNASAEQHASEASAVSKPPLVIGVVEAGRMLGMGRTKAYRLARAGQFPCPILRIGGRYTVPLRGVHALLGYGDDERFGSTSGEADVGQNAEAVPTEP